MELDSFSAILQLAATLNIAFVAVEYAKGYTNTLSEKVFRLPKQIEEAFRPIISKLPDKETLETLKPHEVDGKSTAFFIEKVKREREKINENIEISKKELNEKTTSLCQSKSFSFLSLYFSVYSIVALFFSGFNTENNGCFQVAWTIFTALSCVLAIIGWIFGEKEKQWRCFDFSSLGQSLVFLVIIIVLSVVCGCIKSWDSLDFWHFIVAFTAMLPFLSFIVFFFKIKHKVRKIKAEIQKEVNNFNEAVNKIETDTNVIISSCKIGDYLSTQEKEIEKPSID